VQQQQQHNDGPGDCRASKARLVLLHEKKRTVYRFS
jgi:hypothetical protein